MPCLQSSGPAVEFGMVYELIHKKIVHDNDTNILITNVWHSNTF